MISSATRIPAPAWALVLAFVQTAPEGSLDYIGAGPVEDLVNRHGAALVDSIVLEASRGGARCASALFDSFAAELGRQTPPHIA